MSQRRLGVYPTRYDPFVELDTTSVGSDSTNSSYLSSHVSTSVTSGQYTPSSSALIMRNKNVTWEDDLLPAREKISGSENFPQHPFILIFKDKKMEKNYREFLYGKERNYSAAALFLSSSLVFASWCFVIVDIPALVASIFSALAYFVLGLLFCIPYTLKHNISIEIWCFIIQIVPESMIGSIIQRTTFLDHSVPFLTNTMIATLGFLFIRLRVCVLIFGFIIEGIFNMITIIVFVVTQNLDECHSIYTMLLNYVFVNILIFSYCYFVEKSSRSMFKTLNLLKLEEKLLSIENKRSVRLLYNIFPHCFIAEIRRNMKVEIVNHFKMYEKGGVLVTDLVNFTQFSKGNSSKTIIELLNMICSFYDHCVVSLNLEKVKSVGDGYIAISFGKKYNLNNLVVFGLCILKSQQIPHLVLRTKGTPTFSTCSIDSTESSKEIMKCTKDSTIVKEVTKKWRYNIRVGIACGNLMTIIYGSRSQYLNFDVFGPSVNQCEELEESCVINHIQVSPEVFEKTNKAFDYFSTISRDIDVKKKKKMCEITSNDSLSESIEEYVVFDIKENEDIDSEIQVIEIDDKKAKIEAKKKRNEKKRRRYYMNIVDEKRMIKTAPEYVKYHDTIEYLMPNQKRKNKLKKKAKMIMRGKNGLLRSMDSSSSSDEEKNESLKWEREKEKVRRNSRREIRKKEKKWRHSQRRRKRKNKKKLKQNHCCMKLSIEISSIIEKIGKLFILTPAGFIGVLGSFTNIQNEFGFVRYIFNNFKFNMFQVVVQGGFCFVEMIYFYTYFENDLFIGVIHSYFIYGTIGVDFFLLVLYSFLFLFNEKDLIIQTNIFWKNVFMFINYVFTFIPNALSFCLLITLSLYDMPHLPSLYLSHCFISLMIININFVFHIAIKISLFLLFLPCAALYLVLKYEDFSEGELIQLLSIGFLFFFVCICFVFFDHLRKHDYSALLTLKAKKDVIKNEKKKNQNLALSVLPNFVLRKLAEEKTMRHDIHDRLDGVFGFITLNGCEEHFITNHEKNKGKKMKKMEWMNLFEYLSNMFNEFDRLIISERCIRIKIIRYEMLFICTSTRKNVNINIVRSIQRTLNVIQKCLKYFLNNKVGDVIFKGGVHVGEFSGGVFGSEKYLYDILSHDVNLSARVCSASLDNRIQASKTVVDYLRCQDLNFKFKKSKKLLLNGGEKIRTYVLE